LLIDRMQFRFFEITARVRADPGFRPQPGDLADLEALDTAYAVTRRAEDRATNAWVRSVLLQRAGETAAAERLIEAVRTDRDVARLGTLEPGDRVALTGAFRWLAPRLGELRVRRDAPPADVFDAIEWAKGRALADHAETRAVPPLAELAEALRGTRVHYWTLLPGDAGTHWCLLTDDGTAASGSIPVPLDSIKQVAKPKRIAPSGRGRLPGEPLAPALHWRAVLGPLAAPVAAAQAAGRVRPGDRLVIAPHGSLHAFPLQELPGADGDLGEALHVTRTHSAAALLAVLARPPARPRRAVALWAPTKEEAGHALHVEGFARVVAALRRHLPTEVVEGAAADAEALHRAAAPGVLLHLCAHGTFVEDGPFNHRSRLLLSDGHERPTLASLAESPHHFSPAKLMAAALTGGHVTLQACVSGYATANPQGDAIGLEWAFLLAGAASTLGTHWHVRFEDTADFAATFYDAWLGGADRADAAWMAASRLRRRGSQEWSAFSLTGEWR
jgi:hypothetical protein